MKSKLNIVILTFISFTLRASDFGTTGLIDIPSARMLDDGVLSATISYQKIAHITNITYQATPFLQTSFRYSIFNPSNPIRNPDIDDGLNDRSYSAKLKLMDEGQFKPQISIGIKDILGTGAWGSEYIVGSKRINNLDISLGLGWGRLASDSSIKNPLIGVHNDFETRSKTGVIEGGKLGGKIRVNTFFSGPNVGLFGGINYKIPNSNLSLLMEYNSDSYAREIRKGTILNSSPLSYGIKWTGGSALDISLSYQQGNQVGIALSTKLNTKHSQEKLKIRPFYSSYDGYEISAAPKNLNLNSWYDRLFFDMGKSGLLLLNAKITPKRKQVIVEVSNLQYNGIANAIKRALTLTQLHIPRDISNINIIINENGYRVMTIASQRSSIDSSLNKINFLKGRTIENPTYTTKKLVPRAHIDANISTRFQLFDPDAPLKHQVYLKLNTIVNLPDNWNIFGSFAINIDNNFDTARDPSSGLPHVRTDINQYLTEGSSGIDSLYLEKRASMNDDVYYRLYFGILESMYSGIGAEILYLPFMSRLAFGGTINSVIKRGFARDFELLDYKTTTAFLSLFYASPLYNYDFAIHIGKYLAKDNGATFEIRRTFDNGFSVGAFATFTNISSSDFGEGSFDKGLFFKIPFDFFSSGNTKNGISSIIRSVQRDGGQRLEDFSGRLWHDLRNVRYDSFENNKKRMLVR
jgi:hypothetical protein